MADKQSESGFLGWVEQNFGVVGVLIVIVVVTFLVIGGCNLILDGIFPQRKNLRNAAPAPYENERDPFDGSAGGRR